MGDIDAAHEQIVEAARVDLARRLAELLFPAANELSLVDRPGFAGVPVERVGECLTQQRADDRRGCVQVTADQPRRPLLVKRASAVTCWSRSWSGETTACRARSGFAPIRTEQASLQSRQREVFAEVDTASLAERFGRAFRRFHGNGRNRTGRRTGTQADIRQPQPSAFGRLRRGITQRATLSGGARCPHLLRRLAIDRTGANDSEQADRCHARRQDSRLRPPSRRARAAGRCHRNEQWSSVLQT